MRYIFRGYKILNEELSDPRTHSWPTMSSPIYPVAIIISYLYFVLKWGPALMKNRQPMNLDKAIMVYNLVQIVACIKISYVAMRLAWWSKYQWICEPVDYSNTPEALRLAWIVYCYYIIKISDLLDTVFFVLKKKQSHISFLHVYHHSGMIILSWAGTKYLPGGHGTLVGVINCLVHAAMYMYYFLTVAKPEYKQSIWWKKHITQMQILQFMILFLHHVALVMTPNCGYPKWVAGAFLPQNFFMMILFMDFYRKTYMKKEKTKTDVLADTETDDSIPDASKEAYMDNANGKSKIN